MTYGSTTFQERSVLSLSLCLSPPFTPAWLPAGSEALKADSEALLDDPRLSQMTSRLPAGSETHQNGSKALPAGSETHQNGSKALSGG